MLAETRRGFKPTARLNLASHRYLLTFDTTRTHEDLGLTFPEDYGAIAGYRWMANNVLLVGCVLQMNEKSGSVLAAWASGYFGSIARRLSNGYVVTVDFGALIKLQQVRQRVLVV